MGKEADKAIAPMVIDEFANTVRQARLSCFIAMISLNRRLGRDVFIWGRLFD